MSREGVDAWHHLAKSRDTDALNELLSEDAVFHSPVVHTPQRGKAITHQYLSAAFHVLFNDSFEYVREIVDEHEAMLEFSLELDGIQVNGVDIIRWNADGKIDDFKVMIRPLKGIDIVRAKMAEMLARMSR